MSARLPVPTIPGVHWENVPPAPVLAGVRMDVCAFVGVAPRGPARLPALAERDDGRPCLAAAGAGMRSVYAAVESFDAYRALYGGFEGPGLLPYAVAAFFEQGGARALIVRIVPTAAALADGIARGTLDGVTAGGAPVTLRARDEGSWGNGLRVNLGYRSAPLALVAPTLTGFELLQAGDAQVGDLLRLRLPGGVLALRFVATIVATPHPNTAGERLLAVFDAPLPAVPVAAERVSGTLQADDGAGRVERHDDLGFDARHPRWLADVLVAESALLWPETAWSDLGLVPDDADLPEPIALAATAPFAGGADRYAEIVPEDFFDPGWTPGDEEPGAGVQALAQAEELALLVVPDLYSPEPLVAVDPVVPVVSLAGADFAPCFDLPPTAPPALPPVAELDGLRLDPRLPADRERITELQRALVDFADTERRFIVLLDVPPGLSQAAILAWRGAFASAWAAAYHPWLTVARPDDARDALIRIPPAAVAAGIVAREERERGVMFGPANRIAATVLGPVERLDDAAHGVLHPVGINVYRAERDGVRLSAARTLSRDPQWRQLSVRRLVTLIARTLERELQWLVFEPHTAATRSAVRQQLGAFLGRLYRAGAFRGATEAEAYFVRCDESVNPPAVVDAGRLIAEIGVAPAEPLEFIVLRLARDGDGALVVGA